MKDNGMRRCVHRARRYADRRRTRVRRRIGTCVFEPAYCTWNPVSYIGNSRRILSCARRCRWCRRSCPSQYRAEAQSVLWQAWIPIMLPEDA